MKGGLRVQGDVFLLKIDKMPAGVKFVKRSTRGYVLAEGEATGHSHYIEDTSCKMYELNGVLYLTVSDAVEVKHEEHGAIVGDPGIWKVGTVQEYDAFEEEARNVLD